MMLMSSISLTISGDRCTFLKAFTSMGTFLKCKQRNTVGVANSQSVLLTARNRMRSAAADTSRIACHTSTGRLGIMWLIVKLVIEWLFGCFALLRTNRARLCIYAKKLFLLRPFQSLHAPLQVHFGTPATCFTFRLEYHVMSGSRVFVSIG